MARSTLRFTQSETSITFPNGTVLENLSGNGSASQFTSVGPGLRSAELPSEIDSSPQFEEALQELGMYEQETIHLDLVPEGLLRSGGTEQEQIVLRPAVPPGEAHPRVVLYQDESGGLSWHFSEGVLLSEEEKERLARRGLRFTPSPTPVFVIQTRMGAARDTMASGLPRATLRGPITKLGRKIFKVLVLPLASMVLEKPVQSIVGVIERKYRQNLIWQLTPDNYKKQPRTPFTDWKSLSGRRALLIVHGIFSSAEGMLGHLPQTAMARWCHAYGGRVVGFNHLSVTMSPEDNARFFLEQAKKAFPDGKLEFDILCHSRGGIVSRALVERGRVLFPESNCQIRNVYFVASPNNGSLLGDPEHLVEMLDVFTNFLTNFPDGPIMYSMEVLLAIVKLLAHAGEKNLPGIENMGTRGYIAKVLNAAEERSPARYGAAASDYEPRQGVDNGFFTSRFSNTVMDRIFYQNGQPIANDLVVPRDGVYSSNGHPSFPILNPLLYRAETGVWHSGFFSRPETIAHIDKYLGMAGDGATVITDQVVAGARDELRGTSIGVSPSEPISEPTIVQREPHIDFHELMNEGETSDLVVRLEELDAVSDLESLLDMHFASGQDEVSLTVELGAPGFTIDGDHSLLMTVQRTRNPSTEKVIFKLTANNPGPKPVTCKIIAQFWQANNLIGAVTHSTKVVPKGYRGIAQPAGDTVMDAVRVSTRPREDVDLAICIREIEGQPDTFDMTVRSRVHGKEYDCKSMGKLKLAGTEFSNFFSQSIDPAFKTFPNNPKLTDMEFEQAFAEWNNKFITRLQDLGRKLWTYMPRLFQEEYLHLMSISRPPRSICVYSDEMILPWEIMIPPGMRNGKPFKKDYPLGVLHILGRWKPGLGTLPQPQGLPVQSMVILTPQYVPPQKPLPWAQKEASELKALLGTIEKPCPVNRAQWDLLLNRSDVQVVHYNGHGDLGPNADLNALHLEAGDTIKAMSLVGWPLGKNAHPILYLNVCTVGRTAQNVGRPGGFAANCLAEGWSGVIAPYWPVSDSKAKDFCLSLYAKLKQGLSIGEALQEIRRDNPTDFTAQSYAYFGDPWARLLFP